MLPLAATISTRATHRDSSAGPLADRMPSETNPRVSPRSRLSFRLAAVLLSAVAALGLAELALRVWFPHVRETALPGNLLMISDDLGWSFRPSIAAQHRSRYFDVEYRINAMGFRDAPRTPRLAKRPYRIVAYGDSLVFGWGIPAHARFSNLLEAEVPTVEIWNHAVPGYGLDQEIVLYEKEARTIDVDEVVFFVSLSTLERIHSGYIYAKYKPRFVAEGDGRLRLVPVPHLKNRAVSLTYGLLSRFYLPYFLQVRFDRVRGAFGSRTPTGATDARDRRHVGPLAVALVRRAAAAARAADHRMTVLAANLSDHDRHELRSLCADNAVTYLEIDSSFNVLPDTDERSGIILGNQDQHWNASANRLIAESLKKQMTVTHPRGEL